MSITINSSSPHKRLTSLSAVKRELGLTTSVDDDKTLDDLINQASEFIHQYTDREFARETVTETMPSKGTPLLMLSRTPLISISFIELDGSSVSSTGYEIDDPEAGLIWKEDGWDHTIMIDSNINEFPTRYGRRDWEIKYVAGYILPESTQGTRTLPYDIERACIDIVKSWYLGRLDDPSLKTQKLGDASQTKFDNVSGMSPNTMLILDKWKRFDLTQRS